MSRPPVCLALAVALLGGCLTSNLPSSARPVGDGGWEVGLSGPFSVHMADDPDEPNFPVVTVSTFGGAGADVSVVHGVSDSVDVGVIAGFSDSITGLVKVVLVHRGGVWLSGYGMVRGYFHILDQPLAHGGLIATFGDGPLAFSVGAFYGHWSGITDAAGVADPRSTYAGGGIGVQRDRGGVDMRGMLELQRFGLEGDGITALLFTVYARPH